MRSSFRSPKRSDIHLTIVAPTVHEPKYKCDSTGTFWVCLQGKDENRYLYPYVSDPHGDIDWANGVKVSPEEWELEVQTLKKSTQ